LISFGEEKERLHEKGRESARIYSGLPLRAVAREMKYTLKEVRYEGTSNLVRDECPLSLERLGSP
jgi:hypothetical protein